MDPLSNSGPAIENIIKTNFKGDSELRNLRLRTYFQLNVYIPENEEELREEYEKRIVDHNKKTIDYVTTGKTEFDCGFDLIIPDEQNITTRTGKAQKVSHKIKCSMMRNEPFFLNPPAGSESKPVPVMLYDEYPCGYYLYLRSSAGTKTPLRLANLTGIIDPGYRGEIIAAFDNNGEEDYKIEKHSRLTQICGPDISYPIYIRLVDKVEDLGESVRGIGGFGSSGGLPDISNN
tara:strand:- start:303 stop:1001 length:699 start_codon:yes stop_codon:yes gene_type:complete